jgi:cytochrome c
MMKGKHKTVAAALLGLLLAGMASAQTAQTAQTALVGDIERGRLSFASCRTCHYPESYVGHHNGPSLYKIFGRRAGSTDFAYYSEVMKQSSITWTPELLEFWLANPTIFLKGSTMVSPPVRSAQDRADLIAYLRKASE